MIKIIFLILIILTKIETKAVPLDLQITLIFGKSVLDKINLQVQQGQAEDKIFQVNAMIKSLSENLPSDDSIKNSEEFTKMLKMVENYSYKGKESATWIHLLASKIHYKNIQNQPNQSYGDKIIFYYYIKMCEQYLGISDDFKGEKIIIAEAQKVFRHGSESENLKKLQEICLRSFQSTPQDPNNLERAACLSSLFLMDNHYHFHTNNLIEKFGAFLIFSINPAFQNFQNDLNKNAFLTGLITILTATYYSSYYLYYITRELIIWIHICGDHQKCGNLGTFFQINYQNQTAAAALKAAYLANNCQFNGTNFLC